VWVVYDDYCVDVSTVHRRTKKYVGGELGKTDLCVKQRSRQTCNKKAHFRNYSCVLLIKMKVNEMEALFFIQPSYRYECGFGSCPDMERGGKTVE
jgi:prenyltransferase beta subunit